MSRAVGKSYTTEVYTTRKYAYVWVAIWLLLLLATWFSRPLIPYQETLLAAITWEMYSSGSYVLPMLNGTPIEGSFPLIHWVEVAIWNLFGVSEISLRIVVSLFSLGTLFLTASAAYQLWPKMRDVRANAPLVLIGSLMWTVFATAHIEQVYLTFFLVLGINFIIRIWRYNEPRWWVAYGVTLLCGLFTSGLLFLIYASPILLLQKAWQREGYQYTVLGALVTLGALLLFFVWGAFATYTLMDPNYTFSKIIGWQNFVRQFNNALPLYLHLINFLLALFPWILWLLLYRQLRNTVWDAQLRFVVIWLGVLIAASALTSRLTLLSLYPIFPALSLLIARIYKEQRTTRKEIFFVVLLMVALGVTLVIVPLNHQLFGLPDWVGNVSGLWGAGLVLFAVTLFVYAKETRLLTLSLLSVAMILAVNFGVVREATDFYDLSPAGERISWYQRSGYDVIHYGRYSGQFHFVGRLKEPLLIAESLEEVVEMIHTRGSARLVAYIEGAPSMSHPAIEYWQPFRGKYLVILALDRADEPLLAQLNRG